MRQLLAPEGLHGRNPGVTLLTSALQSHNMFNIERAQNQPNLTSSAMQESKTELGVGGDFQSLTASASQRLKTAKAARLHSCIRLVADFVAAALQLLEM